MRPSHHRLGHTCEAREVGTGPSTRAEHAWPAGVARSLCLRAQDIFSMLSNIPAINPATANIVMHKSIPRRRCRNCCQYMGCSRHSIHTGQDCAEYGHSCVLCEGCKSPVTCCRSEWRRGGAASGLLRAAMSCRCTTTSAYLRIGDVKWV